MTDRRYSQDDIERIFSYYTPVKQKARLYIRDRMGYFGEGFILDEEEAKQLPLSFEAWRRDEWEKYVSLGLRIENGFKDMSRTIERIKQRKETLLRTLSEIHDFEKVEVLLNRLVENSVSLDLWDDVENAKEVIPLVNLSTINRAGVRLDGFDLIKPTLDENNHINLNLTGKGSLREQAETQRRNLRESIWFYLCYEVAIRRRIPDLKLRIPEYESLMSKFQAVIRTPLSLIPRWGGQDIKIPPSVPQEHQSPSLMRMIENYSVEVEDINLETPESQEKITEIYKQI